MKKKSNESCFDYFSKILLITKLLILLLLISSIHANANRLNSSVLNSDNKIELNEDSQPQQREVKGIVKDENDEPLVGVNVYIKESFKGAVTDINGEFTIQVESDEDILIFSSIGMETQEIMVGTQTFISVILKQAVLAIDDVVVVAYGTRRKGAITGAVEVVDAEQMDQTPVTSFDQALQGKATGVQVIQNNGMPGSKAEIKIRGTGSIAATQEPLFVIDGIPTDASGFSELNPNDIESMSILKDASAASLYGSRAANGVVLITTKTGRTGETDFTFRATSGLSVRTSEKFTMMNAQELIDYEVLIGRRQAYDPNDPDIQELLANDHSWMDDIFRTGKNNSYELAASGGNKKTNFYTSLSYFKQEGIITGTDLGRYSGRLNLKHKVNDKLNFGSNITLGNSHINTASTATNGTNPMISGYMNRPYHAIKNEDGSWGETHWSGNWNYFEMAENITQYDDNYKMLGKVFIEFEPIEGLKLKESYGLDFSEYERYYFLQPDARDVTENGRSSYMTNYASRYVTTVSTTTLNYNKLIANDHNVNVLLGFEVNESNFKDFSAEGITFPTDLTTTLDAAAEPDAVSGTSTAWSLVSYFANLHYDFRSKYILDLSVRRDGSSRFGSNNRYGNFYSVGLGWNLHSESFIRNLSFVNILRLRGSYGTSGNFDIADFEHLDLYSFDSYNGRNISYPSQLSNEDLTWEKNEIMSVGIDFGLFDGRLNGTLDYYNRITKDLLHYVNLSYTSGFGSQVANVGSIKNEGYEIALEGKILDWNGLQYNLGVSVSANRNEVLELYGGEDIVGALDILREGAPMNSYYLVRYAGVNRSNGEPLFYTEDGRITSTYSGNDRVLLDQTLDPDYFGTLSNKISYKGFDLSADFYYSIGNYAYNGLLILINSDGIEGGNQSSNALYDSWKQPGDYTEIPKQDQNIPRADRSTRELEDASFLRLKDVTLAYTIPERITQKVRLGSIRLYAKGMNLWTYTKFSGLDPEMKYGFWRFDYPPARTFTFGMDIKF